MLYAQEGCTRSIHDGMVRHFLGVENLHKIYVFFARVEIQHTFLVVYMSPTEIFVTMKETLTGIPISLAYHFDAKSCIRNGFD